MELALVFSLAGVAIAICATVAVVFMNADRHIIMKNKKKLPAGRKKVPMMKRRRRNRDDVIRFGTTMLAKRLEATEENKFSQGYGKISIVKNKTDEEMKKIDGSFVINSVAAAAPEFAGLTGDYGYMNTRILNNMGHDIYIQHVFCSPDLVSNDIENICVNTYFVPTVIKNGAIINFPFACILSKAASLTQKFVVDLSISDTGVVSE